MARDDDDDFDDAPDSPRRRLLQGLARRLQDPRKLSGDAMDVLSSVIETSDRAKTEAVKLLAREVRGYLEALQLKDDLHWLLTNHSLEVKMSLSLKPLAGAVAPPGERPVDTEADEEPPT